MIKTHISYSNHFMTLIFFFYLMIALRIWIKALLKLNKTHTTLLTNENFLANKTFSYSVAARSLKHPPTNTKTRAWKANQIFSASQFSIFFSQKMSYSFFHSPPSLSSNLPRLLCQVFDFLLPCHHNVQPYSLQNHNMLYIIKLISSLDYLSKHCDYILAKGFLLSCCNQFKKYFLLNCRGYQLNLGPSSPKIRLNLCPTYNQHTTGISSVYDQLGWVAPSIEVGHMLKTQKNVTPCYLEILLKMNLLTIQVKETEATTNSIFSYRKRETEIPISIWQALGQICFLSEVVVFQKRNGRKSSDEDLICLFSPNQSYTLALPTENLAAICILFYFILTLTTLFFNILRGLPSASDRKMVPTLNNILCWCESLRIHIKARRGHNFYPRAQRVLLRPYLGEEDGSWVLFGILSSEHFIYVFPFILYPHVPVNCHNQLHHMLNTLISLYFHFVLKLERIDSVMQLKYCRNLHSHFSNNLLILPEEVRILGHRKLLLLLKPFSKSEHLHMQTGEAVEQVFFAVISEDFSILNQIIYYFYNFSDFWIFWSISNGFFSFHLFCIMAPIIMMVPNMSLEYIIKIELSMRIFRSDLNQACLKVGLVNSSLHLVSTQMTRTKQCLGLNFLQPLNLCFSCHSNTWTRLIKILRYYLVTFSIRLLGLQVSPPGCATDVQTGVGGSDLAEVCARCAEVELLRGTK
ncbi:hypothetical protein VP01_2575g1 [Puccinia sorghi]|uniref:Uncharacterized protein n=1 Tax=Puccinia sorghi TaxID=27349 RepID=A0A0L6V6R2_9BASI|nr:hypothetical protein VP01_2575g1 [Puccinia sorghi]